MGGCAGSKYVVDEDNKKESKKPKDKKEKGKSKNLNKSASNTIVNETKPANGHVNDTNAVKQNEEKKSLEDGLEFIDKEEIDKQNAQQQQQQEEENDNGKKEVTTYQTTVVKHVSKEGDDLLVHLKDEAFQSLKNFFKQEAKSNETTVKSTIDGEKVSTSSYNNNNKNEEEFLNEIKTQVINAIRNTFKNEPVEAEVNEKLINSILEYSSGLLKNGSVNSMTELETSLNRQFPNEELLIQKIINSTTGFLTAKGTEAGTMLSSILANLTNSSIQGELKETEKTTVKVTRTITEKIVNSKGETKTITRKVTDTISNPTNLPPEELVKQLATEQRNRNVAAEVLLQSSNIEEETKEEIIETSGPLNQASSEQHELNDDEIEVAKEVVNNVVHAAILRVSQEELKDINNNHNSNNVETNEEEEDGGEVELNKCRDDVASEFYKSGKDAAEKLIKIVEVNSNNNDNNNNNANTSNNNNNPEAVLN